MFDLKQRFIRAAAAAVSPLRQKPLVRARPKSNNLRFYALILWSSPRPFSATAL